MNTALCELWFLSRDRAALVWIAIALIAASIAVYFGIAEVSAQRATLERLKSADRIEQAVALKEHRDWGSIAYYTFHLTYDAPSDFAFAALGQRDVSPWKHRIRMLALEGQIYETDSANPEFSLIGRFDFAFVVSVVTPLLIILLLHDIRSGEREKSRFELLTTMSQGVGSLWWWRAAWRCLFLILALLIPLWIAAILSGTAPSKSLFASGVVVGHVAFWWLVAAWINKKAWSSFLNLTSLVGIWLLLSVIIPFSIKEFVDRSIAVPDGGQIMLVQREAVNDAWDLPVAATMDPFMARHPDWSDYAEIEGAFEWKWYYAFQQVGDQIAEPLSKAYRDGREKRERLSRALSWLSPASKAERTLQMIAGTDVRSTWRYEDRIRDFHSDLRSYYYARLFPKTPFSDEDVNARPQFSP